MYATTLEHATKRLSVTSGFLHIKKTRSGWNLEIQCRVPIAAWVVMAILPVVFVLVWLNISRMPSGAALVSLGLIASGWVTLCSVLAAMVLKARAEYLSGPLLRVTASHIETRGQMIRFEEIRGVQLVRGFVQNMTSSEKELAAVDQLFLLVRDGVRVPIVTTARLPWNNKPRVAEALALELGTSLQVVSAMGPLQSAP
jgi:hypothetical protein